MTSRVFSINIGKEKGNPKDMVRSAIAREDFGLEGDVHAGPGDRQVSLLSVEAVEELEKGVTARDVDLRPGIFAENITTVGLDLTKIKVGDILRMGDEVVLKVTAIGKTCHSGCDIMKSLGICIMPQKGLFAIVEKGGRLFVRDKIFLEGRTWLKR